MKALIIGGGIIGLCSAYYLHKAGWEVTVLDKNELADNCSYGNAGMIVPSHFVSLSSPGIVSKGLRWMLDSTSPFYIRPSFHYPLLKWGLKFLHSANAEHVEKSAPHLKDLNLLSRDLYEELAKEPGFDFGFTRNGILMYYRSEKTAEEESILAEKAKILGLHAEILNKQELADLEPDLEMDVLGAVHYRCDAHLDPELLMQQLIAWLKNNKITIHTGCEVTGLKMSGKKVKNIITSKGEFESDEVIIATGSRLSEVCHMFGTKLLLVPGRGYSITINNPLKLLRIPSILCEARVAITPMGNRIRYAGTMEIGKESKSIHLKRVQGIVAAVNQYFPKTNLVMPEKQYIWHGYRPCSPDGLPYLGRTKKSSNVIIAGGHSMMGLSLGPATGKIVSELAGHENSSLPVDMYNPDRFS